MKPEKTIVIMGHIQDEHTFEVPEAVLRLAATLISQNSATDGRCRWEEVPTELTELATSHRLVVYQELDGFYFEQKCSLTDHPSKLMDIASIRIRHLEDLSTIADLIKSLRSGFGVLPYLENADSDELTTLWTKLQRHGLVSA